MLINWKNIKSEPEQSSIVLGVFQYESLMPLSMNQQELLAGYSNKNMRVRGTGLLCKNPQRHGQFTKPLETAVDSNGIVFTPTRLS